MDDSTLTRLAIEEIVRDIGNEKEDGKKTHELERKTNPLGKPNKRFLGRTLNSMLLHNKRNDDRTQESCRRKLKELDNKRKRRRKRGHSDGRASRKSCSESSHEVFNSSSMSSEDEKRHRKKKRKKAKRTKRTKRSKSSSSSSIDFETVKKPKDEVYKSETLQYENGGRYESTNNYISGSIQAANAVLLAAMYSDHVNQMLYQQSLFADNELMENSPKVEPSSERLSDIEFSPSLSNSSSSSSLLSLSSSIEVDENGMPTIQVSSDESSTVRHKRRKKTMAKDHSSSIISVESNSCESLPSTTSKIASDAEKCISLDSDTQASNCSDDNIVILTHSPEVGVEAESHHETIQPSDHITEGVPIDLTDE